MSRTKVYADFHRKVDTAHHLPNQPQNNPLRRTQTCHSGISEKMLIDELKFLCGKGLVKKKQYPEVPPRVEYSLTPLGEKVLPIIDEIAKFGMENL